MEPTNNRMIVIKLTIFIVGFFLGKKLDADLA